MIELQASEPCQPRWQHAASTSEVASEATSQAHLCVSKVIDPVKLPKDTLREQVAGVPRSTPDPLIRRPLQIFHEKAHQFEVDSLLLAKGSRGISMHS